jgi:ubiquinone/menaquinone biosynthesis C-methylase UbiE
MTLLKQFFGRGVFPARYAWFLEGPWRRVVLSPERLRQRLVLAPEHTVLEIGAGGGYYARPLAPLVRRFIALDLQADMLARLRRTPAGVLLLPIQADASTLPLADGSIDVVIAVTVLGEVRSTEQAIAEVRRVLRPGGLFSVSEHWPDPDFMSFTRIREACCQHGLQLQACYGTTVNYTANFRANAA